MATVIKRGGGWWRFVQASACGRHWCIRLQRNSRPVRTMRLLHLCNKRPVIGAESKVTCQNSIFKKRIKKKQNAVVLSVTGKWSLSCKACLSRTNGNYYRKGGTGGGRWAATITHHAANYTPILTLQTGLICISCVHTHTHTHTHTRTNQ